MRQRRVIVEAAPSTASTTLIYVRDGQNVLIEVTQGSGVLKSYTQWPGAFGGLVSQRLVPDGGTAKSSFYSFDGSDNTRLLSNESGTVTASLISAPNLRNAKINARNDSIALEFDQPIEWNEKRVSQFYLDGEKGRIACGSVAGNVLSLKLKQPTTAKWVTYLKEANWNQDTLLLGTNGIAALTFCEVPLTTGNKIP